MLKSTAVAIALLVSSGAAFAQYTPDSNPPPANQQMSPTNPQASPAEPSTTGQAIEPAAAARARRTIRSSSECIPEYDASGAQVRPCPNAPR